jgi:hypothetical protein
LAPPKDYVRFYQRILPIGTVSWSRFEVVSTDFAKVIRRLNEYFGTALREFEHTEGYAARCFAILAAYERGPSGDNIETWVARPSEQRGRMKDVLREGFRSKDLARLHADAYGLYDKFTSP